MAYKRSKITITIKQGQKLPFRIPISKPGGSHKDHSKYTRKVKHKNKRLD